MSHHVTPTAAEFAMKWNVKSVQYHDLEIQTSFIAVMTGTVKHLVSKSVVYIDYLSTAVGHLEESLQ